MSSYDWVIAPAVPFVNNGSTITVDWSGATAGNYNVSVNYDDANSCTAAASTSKTITVNSLPTPTLIAPDKDVCLNEEVVYTTQASYNFV